MAPTYNLLNANARLFRHVMATARLLLPPDRKSYLADAAATLAAVAAECDVLDRQPPTPSPRKD